MDLYGIYYEALQRRAFENNLPFNGQGTGLTLTSAAANIAPDDGGVGTDPVDLAQTATLRNITIVVLDYRANMLRLINYALERMGNEVYGPCISCEEDIPQNRLMAVPESPFCIDCQNKLTAGDLPEYEHWCTKTPQPNDRTFSSPPGGGSAN